MPVLQFFCLELHGLHNFESVDLPPTLRDEPMSGKQQVQIIEWIHFHPLKKLLIFGLWGFGVVLVLRGIG